MDKRKQSKSQLDNLIPFDEQKADEARAIQSAGGKASARARVEKRTMRERFLALRDMELPLDEQTETCRTYGDAWAESMSRIIREGKGGAVEALKLTLGQIGEDAAEKQEIKIIYDEESKNLMG